MSEIQMIFTYNYTATIKDWLSTLIDTALNESLHAGLGLFCYCFVFFFVF